MNRKVLFLFSFIVCVALAVTCIAAPSQDVENTELTPVLKGLNFTNGLVTADFLNLRQGPATDYEVIEILQSGDSVKVIGQIGEWYAVYNQESGRVGSVYCDFLSLTEPTIGKQESKDKQNDDKEESKKTENDKEESKKEESKKSESDKEESKKAESKKESTEKDRSVFKKNKLSKDEKTLLELVNTEREKNNLDALEVNDVLMETAKMKADDMVENGYFSHQSPTYGSPFDMMKDKNLEFRCAGENIAGNKTVEGAFKAWMKKEGNKSNILNPDYQYIGIGICDSETYGKVLVQQFIGE